MNSYIHSANQTSQQYDVTSQYSVLFITWCCRWFCLDAAGEKNWELRNGNCRIYTISHNVTVVADALYHLTVAVETDTGKVPQVLRKQL
jgi:hypothetical protein